jgi:hypothetical protein
MLSNPELPIQEILDYIVKMQYSCKMFTTLGLPYKVMGNHAVLYEIVHNLALPLQRPSGKGKPCNHPNIWEWSCIVRRGSPDHWLPLHKLTTCSKVLKLLLMQKDGSGLTLSTLPLPSHHRRCREWMHMHTITTQGPFPRHHYYRGHHHRLTFPQPTSGGQKSTRRVTWQPGPRSATNTRIRNYSWDPTTSVLSYWY